MAEVFCGVIINEVMPAVRAAVALRMLDLGFSQISASQKLGITQPAISQYKKGIRGELSKKIQKNQAMCYYIEQLTREVVSNGVDINTQLCCICEEAKKNGIANMDKNFLCVRNLERKAVN